MLKFIVADPESGLKRLGSGIRDKHPRSATVGPRHQTNAGTPDPEYLFDNSSLKYSKVLNKPSTSQNGNNTYDIKFTSLP
jgi:hypothetical protein